MIALAYNLGNKTSRVRLEAFTLVKPLNVVGMRVGCGFELSFSIIF